jgi:hypothetical protein
MLILFGAQVKETAAVGVWAATGVATKSIEHI